MEKILKRVPEQSIIERNDFLVSETDRMLSVSNGVHSVDNDECIRMQEEIQLLHTNYDFNDSIFEENGMKGLKDIKGNIRVPALYYGFSETYDYNRFRNYPVCALDSNGKYLLVSADGSGKPLSLPVYDSIGLDILSGFFIAVKDGRRGILDYKGQELVPFEIDIVYGMSNGIMILEQTGKLGLLTETGLYVAPQYSEVEEEDGVVRVCREGEWGYIGKDGRFVSEQEFETGNASLLSF